MDDSLNIMVLGKQLKKILKEKGIKLADLAKLAGVPKQTLWDWAEGSSPKSIRQIKKVADALEVTLDELCFGENSNKPSTVLSDYLEEINAGVFEVILRKRN